MSAAVVNVIDFRTTNGEEKTEESIYNALSFHLMQVTKYGVKMAESFLRSILESPQSECRKHAKAGDAETAASCLGTAVGYYPSGTVIKTGTSFDVLVESDRDFTVDYIILLLKEKTKLDLGNNPNAWLSHFESKK